MSFAIRPTNCKRCGKLLSMFEGRYCLECQKEIDKELEIYEGNTGVFDEPYPWRLDEIIGILKHIIEVADTNSCGVKEIDGIDEEAINNAITIISSFEQIKWERDTAIAQLKELGYEFGEKIEPCDDLISRQAVLDAIEDDNRNGHYSCFASNNDAQCFKDVICSLPSVNPQEPKTGHWKSFTHSAYHGIDDDGEPIWREVKVYHCNLCNRRTVIKEKYCPNCGARMAESEDKE